MNPQTAPGNLDPKLKETYNRVMNTQTNTPGSTTEPTLSGHAVSQANTAPQAEPASHPMTPPVVQTQPQASTTPVPSVAPQTFTGNQIVAPTMAKPEKIVITPQAGSGGMKQILYIVAAVLFFAAYTLFWMRYFHIVKLPFF